MSYILDALKRADAERDRGHVPGLRSQPVSATAPARRRPRAGRHTLLWLGLLGLLAVLLVLGAWWFGAARPPFTRPDAPPASPPEAVPPPAAAPVPAPPPAAAPAPAPVPPEGVNAPATPLLAPEIAPAPQPAARATGTAPAPTAAVPASSATSPAAAPGAAGLPELPAGNGQLPALRISGSTYSENPAHRMLIVNGKVLLEGQEVAPGLKLEVIGPRSAVFNHQGARYNVNY